MVMIKVERVWGNGLWSERAPFIFGFFYVYAFPAFHEVEFA